MLTLDDIQRARTRIAGHVIATPLVGSPWLSAKTGASVRLKLESLQVSHSFKVRGALNAVLRLREAPGSPPPVVTASAGNHGSAVAWAADLSSIPATVFTPRDAPRSKLNAIRQSGADLRDVADHYEHAEQLALAYAREHGAVFISPYNHPDVIAGAGTTGLEILGDWLDVDAVVVPVGGGGLISGIAIALKALKPGVRVIGVEADASCAFSAARRAGHIVRVEVGPTIADGLGGNVEPDTLTWPYVRDLVDEVVTVPEADLWRGIRDLLAEEHLVAEGAGIAGIAALLGRHVTLEAQRVAVIVSGANIDLTRLREVIAD
jgi:threonine dehydratase